MRHQILRQKINQYLNCLIMIYNFDFLVSRLPDIAQILFCTPDGATSPTFQMRYSMFVTRDVIQTILGAFFLGHPVFLFLSKIVDSFGLYLHLHEKTEHAKNVTLNSFLHFHHLRNC